MREYSVWLASLKGISNKKKIELSQAFGGAEGLYKAYDSQLRESGILTKEEIECLHKHREQFDFVRQIDRLKTLDIDFVSIEESEFPYRLSQIPGPPYGLYYRGKLLDDKKTISIVGARACSQYGRAVAEELSSALTSMGYVIVSGMARGIDAIAHRACLKEGGRTIAVFGCGVDVCYPHENLELYHRIPEAGCLFSEFPPGTEPLGAYFPSRNRIISGLSDGVIVIEARERSGTLITADFALEQGRDVYALPGRITDPLSMGCNKLIAEGAYMIRSTEELLSGMVSEDSTGSALVSIQDPRNLNLEKEEFMVYSCLDFYAKSIEDICNETNLPLIQLLSYIMDLCDKGLIKECFKNQYIRIR